VFRAEVMDLCERGEGDLACRKLNGRKTGRVENSSRIPYAVDADGTVVGTRKWDNSG
jgi:hypothetical protein